MKRIIFSVMFICLMLTQPAWSDSVLFPYFNSNPGNVATLISVINTANLGSLGCGPTEQLQIHIRYFYKDVTAAALDPCTEKDFFRPTTPGDIVTFDASGQVEGGNAMFNDATNYNGGAGAPRFDLPNMGVTGAVRGYLLVNHRCSATGELPGVAGDIDGEAMLLDLVNGAAWSYRGVIADPTAAGIGNYAFTALTGPGTTGSSTDVLPENTAMPAGGIPFGAANMMSQLQPVGIYPPDDFQTRFFVTPLVIDNTVSTNNNMSMNAPLAQKRTRIALRASDGQLGIDDRNEQPQSTGGPVHVRCVAGVNLSDLTGGLAGWFTSQGGVAYLDLLDPTAIDNTENIVANSDHSAIVFKLQFGTPSWVAGSMINAADLIRDNRIND